MCVEFHGLTAGNCLNCSGTCITLQHLRIIQLLAGQDLWSYPAQPPPPKETVAKHQIKRQSGLCLAESWKPPRLETPLPFRVTCPSATPFFWCISSFSAWVLLLVGININQLNVPQADFSFLLPFVDFWLVSFKVPFSNVAIVALRWRAWLVLSCRTPWLLPLQAEVDPLYPDVSFLVLERLRKI